MSDIYTKTIKMKVALLIQATITIIGLILFSIGTINLPTSLIITLIGMAIGIGTIVVQTLRYK